MKGFLSFVITILLLMAVGGGVYMWYTGGLPEPPAKESTSSEEKESTSDKYSKEDIFDDFESNSKPNTSESSGGNESNSGSDTEDDESSSTPSIPDEPVIRELTVPDNVNSLTVNGLIMQEGAAVKISENTYRPRIRYTADVSLEVMNSLGANYKLGIMMAPLKYFERVNVDSYTVIDWITAFEDAGLSYISSEVTETIETETGYVTRFVMSDINYENVNRYFTAIPFVKITSGSNVTYKYGTFPTGITYRSNARSVAYIASAALNAQALGQASYTESQLQKLNEYIDESVDLANGLIAPVYDGSLYDFTMICEATPLSIGETRDISVRIKEEVDIAIAFVSSDTSVVTVDSNGVMTAVGKGSATVNVYIVGKSLPLEITVA